MRTGSARANFCAFGGLGGCGAECGRGIPASVAVARAAEAGNCHRWRWRGDRDILLDNVEYVNMCNIFSVVM